MNSPRALSHAEIRRLLELAAAAIDARPSFTTGSVPMCRPAEEPPCAAWCLDAAHSSPTPCAPTLARFMRDAGDA